jgi:hypothetical protein
MQGRPAGKNYAAVVCCIKIANLKLYCILLCAKISKKGFIQKEGRYGFVSGYSLEKALSGLRYGVDYGGYLNRTGAFQLS